MYVMSVIVIYVDYVGVVILLGVKTRNMNNDFSINQYKFTNTKMSRL